MEAQLSTEKYIKARQFALELAHDDVYLNAFVLGNARDAAHQRAWQLVKEIPAHLLSFDSVWLGALVYEMLEV